MILAGNINAKESSGAECLKESQSQAEINSCAGGGFKEADAELNRVYQEILVIYKDDKEFLKKLKAAQLVWIKSRDADMDMIYPLEHTNQNYGSAFSMCFSGFKEIITLARVEFLKRWTKGHESEDMCTGSIIHSYCIKNDCSKL